MSKSDEIRIFPDGDMWCASSARIYKRVWPVVSGETCAQTHISSE